MHRAIPVQRHNLLRKCKTYMTICLILHDMKCCFEVFDDFSLPGSLKPALTHWESQRRSQLQYKGLAPRALNTHKHTIYWTIHTTLAYKHTKADIWGRAYRWDRAVRWLKAPSGIVERSLPWRVLEERRVNMDIKLSFDLVKYSRGRFGLVLLCELFYCVINSFV